MPIFPGPVSHNNPNAPIVDATGNQIKGFGFFDSISERDLLHVNLRVPGFVAIVDQQGYVFTGERWEEETDWTAFPAESAGIKGGDKYSILSKASNNDFDYEWSRRPSLEAVRLFGYSDTGTPEIKFTNSSDLFESNSPLSSGASIGSLKFAAYNTNRDEAIAGRIEFTQSEVATDSGYIDSSFSVYTANSSDGEQLSLTVNNERVVKVEPLSKEPTAVPGGIYMSSDYKFYFGTE